MSAVKGPEQNLTFIYSNFYEIYRKNKMQAQAKEELAKGVVLKTHSVVETPAPAEVRVISSQQNEGLRQWATHSEKQGEGKKEIASHLRSLRDARKRLNFLMSEMDELLKRS